MKNLKDGFAHLFLVFAVVVAGLLTLAYFAYKNGQISISPLNTPTNSSVPNTGTADTSDWQTYTSESLGFTFKYPKDWDHEVVSWDGGPGETSADYDGIRLTPQIASTKNSVINIYSVKNNGLSIQEYFNKNDYGCCGDDATPTYLGNKIMTSEVVYVDGVETRKLPDAPEDIPVEGVSANWVVVEKDGKVYLLSFTEDINETEIDIKQTFDQLLSTFKFLEDSKSVSLNNIRDGFDQALIHQENTSDKLAEAMNTNRKYLLTQLYKALVLYIQENNNSIPIEITEGWRHISKEEADICSLLVPNYIGAIPRDTRLGEYDNYYSAGGFVYDCETDYQTGFAVKKAANKILVAAPLAEKEIEIVVSE